MVGVETRWGVRDAAFFAAGAGTMTAALSGLVPLPLTALLGAALFIVLVPRRPRQVVAFVGGAAAAFVTLLLLMVLNPAWDGCATTVNGVLVEYRCSEGPPPR